MQKRKVVILLKNFENKYKQPSQDDLSNSSVICSSRKQDWWKFVHLSCCPKPSPCRVWLT